MEMSLEAAAGLFFEERSAILTTLGRLLQVTIAITNKSLRRYMESLCESDEFVTSLVTSILDVSLMPSDISSLKYVLNNRKARELRCDIVLLEKTRLCEILLLLCHHFGASMTKDKHRITKVLELLLAIHTYSNIPNLEEDTADMYENQALLVVMALITLVTTLRSDPLLSQCIQGLTEDVALVQKFLQINTDGFVSMTRLMLGLFLSSEESHTYFRDARHLGFFSYIRIRVLNSLFFSK
jgi:hypothetical protein